jgi:hypothetical protein
MPGTFQQVAASCKLVSTAPGSASCTGPGHRGQVVKIMQTPPAQTALEHQVPLQARCLTCSALNVFFFISISAAGLSPQRSATRIICSRCLPSSLGVSGLCFSGKKILNTVLNLSIRLLRWLPSSLTRRAMRRATSWLAEEAAAARLVEPRGEEESPGVLRAERGRGPRRGGGLGRRPGLVRLGVACGGGDRMRGCGG